MKQLFYHLSWLLLFTSCQSSEVNIIDNKTSNYKIAIDKNASAEIQDAANILQIYIEKCTDVKLAIVKDYDKNTGTAIELKINKKDSTHFINYQINGTNLIIEGSNAQYLKYAVYEFLEQELSCRFWTPDAEQTPHCNKLALDKTLTYYYAPPIHVRTVHSKLYYNNHAFADKQRVTYEAFPNYAPQAKVHTFHRFVPADEYFKTHPEYYALVNGKRRTTQLCLSNAEVLEIIKQKVAQTFKENPNATVVSVSQDDNTQYCRCEHCVAIDKEEGAPSGSVIRFVNKIATDFPDKQISTLAYQYTRKACKTKPADNVLVTLCSIECDRSAPIEIKSPDFANDLRDWKKLTNHIRIWDYTTQFTNFLAPFPNINTLQPNIKFFSDNHAQWIFEQHSHNPSELFELRSYLMARLLWNPEQNTKAIINEFTDGYYGVAGPGVAKYVQMIHEYLDKDPDFFLFLYGGPSQAFNSFLKPIALDAYNQYFDEAELAIKDDTELLKRVKRARLSVRYATLEACRANLTKKYSLSNTDFVNDELEGFALSCDDGDITMMNETRFMVSDYLALYKNNLNRATSKNIAVGCPVELLTTPKKYANEDPQSLTDNAFGGGSFYANWLGFEGNDMEAVIDLKEEIPVQHIAIAFLQVVNHVVFFPLDVTYYTSLDGVKYTKLESVKNSRPLTRDSKINDIQLFEISFTKTKTRYIKIKANNMKTPPEWHHAVGLSSWIFADEIQVN